MSSKNCVANTSGNRFLGNKSQLFSLGIYTAAAKRAAAVAPSLPNLCSGQTRELLTTSATLEQRAGDITTNCTSVKCPQLLQFSDKALEKPTSSITKEKRLSFCFCRNLSAGIRLKHLLYCFYCLQCALFGEHLCNLQEIHLKPFKSAGGLPWHFHYSNFLLKQLYTKVNSPLRA